jgi:uncharacterized protein (TIGR03000 family)
MTQVPAIGPYSEVGPSMMGPTLPSASQSGANLTGLGGEPQNWMGREEVVCPGGLYGGYFRPFNCRAYSGAGYYGFFRRYYGYGYYGPNYRTGSGGENYGLGEGCLFSPRRACLGRNHSGVVKSPYYVPPGPIPFSPPCGMNVAAHATNPSAGPAAGTAQPPAEKAAPEKLPPPTGNTAQLQLIVPENAEVLVNGGKTRKTGTVREFVSPPLAPGKNLVYTIAVRHTDAGGKITEDTHTVRVQPNARLRIDCTRPATPLQPRAALDRP